MIDRRSRDLEIASKRLPLIGVTENNILLCRECIHIHRRRDEHEIGIDARILDRVGDRGFFRLYRIFLEWTENAVRKSDSVVVGIR